VISAVYRNSSLHFCSIGAVEKRQLAVINEEKKLKKSGYKNSGILFVKNFVTEKHVSFVDYIQVKAMRRRLPE
jgi:hypothetical protein